MNWNDASEYCRALQVPADAGHYWDLPIMLSETDRSCINYVRRTGCRVFRHAPLGACSSLSLLVGICAC